MNVRKNLHATRFDKRYRGLPPVNHISIDFINQRASAAFGRRRMSGNEASRIGFVTA
jgi:hypothetical protein